MKGQRAALYLRSSKDRKDVSIESQRRQLRQLAADRGLLIVAEYADVVESGKDEFRPGFQRMLAELRASDRAWSFLLLLDTSRLARRRLTSVMFEEIDAKRRGITILYKNLPELDEAESMLLRNQLQGIDEYHSLVSKRKGLGGMATNIENGYRAGGRAPRGYQLKRIPTGTVREGVEVTKSVLEPSPDAPLITRYLKARVAGRSRKALQVELGLPWSMTSLIGMEWNALTYAGHTVWNVHNEFERGRGYKNQQKRRPRSEWLIKRNTHPALISDEEAEQLFEQLEASPHHAGGKYRTSATYLLTGLLKTPGGEAWQGNGEKRYRARKDRKHVSQERLEHLVVEKVFADLQSYDFARRLCDEARRYAAQHREDPAAELRAKLGEINGRISRMMELAARMVDPDPALREIEALERQRKALDEEIKRLAREHAEAARLTGLTEPRMRRILANLVQEMRQAHREGLKDVLNTLVDQIVLDPATLECQIHYRVAVNSVASPRECSAIPILRMIASLQAA